MSKVYPSSFYGDPANCVEELRRMERVVRRYEAGCRKCAHSPDGGWSCEIGNLPGHLGYCNDWTDPK